MHFQEKNKEYYSKKLLKKVKESSTEKLVAFLYLIYQNYIMSHSTKSNNLEYFSGIVKSLKNSSLFESKGKLLTDMVSEKLQEKILTSQVTLPAEIGVKKLLVPKKVVEVPQESEQDLLKKVEVEKMSLLEKMRDLSKQQDELKTKIKATSSKQKIVYQPKISEEQKERFKQLVKSNRLFQRSLKKKNKQITELYREKSLQNIKQSQQQQNAKRESKREKAIQKLKSLQLRIAQRKQAYQQSLNNLKQIKDKQYLYMKNLQEDEQKRQESQKQYQQKLSEIKQSLRIDIEAIKQHEKKYEQHLYESQMRIQQRSIENTNHKHTKSYADNYFSVVTKARLEQQKLSQYERLNQGHLFKERICKFQQKLSTEFKPKISNNSKFTPMKQSLSAHALSNTQQRQRGIQYLQIAKKLKDAQKQKKKRMTIPAPSTILSYKDYSKDLKYKTSEKAENKFSTLVKHKNSLSNYQYASQALELAAQIEAKSKLSSDKKLLKSVQHKIQLLNALQ